MSVSYYIACDARGGDLACSRCFDRLQGRLWFGIHPQRTYRSARRETLPVQGRGCARGLAVYQRGSKRDEGWLFNAQQVASMMVVVDGGPRSPSADSLDQSGSG